MNPQAPFSSGSHGLATSVDELLPPLEFQQSDFQPDGPMASLRLEALHRLETKQCLFNLHQSLTSKVARPSFVLLMISWAKNSV